MITFTDPALRLDPPDSYRNSLGYQVPHIADKILSGNKGSVLWLPLRNLSKNMGRLQFIEVLTELVLLEEDKANSLVLNKD